MMESMAVDLGVTRPLHYFWPVTPPVLPPLQSSEVRQVRRGRENPPARARGAYLLIGGLKVTATDRESEDTDKLLRR